MELLNTKPFLNCIDSDEENKHTKEIVDILHQAYSQNDYFCVLAFSRMNGDIEQETLVLDCKLSEAYSLCLETVNPENGVDLYCDDGDFVMECTCKLQNEKGRLCTPIYEARIIPYDKQRRYIKLFQ